MKSSGRISFQRSTTSFDFEKKRWPPMSKWNSPWGERWRTVRLMPPT